MRDVRRRDWEAHSRASNIKPYLDSIKERNGKITNDDIRDGLKAIGSAAGTERELRSIMKAYEAINAS